MGYIYKLDFAGGKSYVGMTIKSVQHRLQQHRCTAVTVRSERLVYNAWRKHGEPTVSILAEAPDERLPDLERRYIAEFCTLTPGGYNLTVGGEATQGYRHTSESRLRMRLAHLGKPHPIRGRPSPHRGRALTSAHRAKLAAALIGKAHTELRRVNQSIGQQRRYVKMLADGTPHHRTGTRHTEEARVKAGLANIGRVLPPEHRAALSAGAKAYHAAQRAAKNARQPSFI